MRKINTSDRIFATVINGGTTIYSVTLGGISSIEEIVRKISTSIKGLATGLVTIVLRNSSQGWSERRALRLRPARPEGLQLSLF